MKAPVEIWTARLRTQVSSFTALSELQAQTMHFLLRKKNGPRDVDLFLFGFHVSLSLILEKKKLKKRRKRFSVFIFRERGREGAREGEKHGRERETSIGCLCVSCLS